ncbi:MAG: terminase small subunit [Faecalibacterium sp.]
MTDKQRRFCEEYMIDLNATQAAIRAGYSLQTAEQIGYQLLQKTSVCAEIARLQAAQSARTGINADRVLREYARIAFANLPDIAGEDGTLRDGLSRDDASAIQSVRVKITDSGVEREVKLHDKLHALDALAKHLGIAAPKNSSTSDTGQLERLLEALKTEVAGHGE